jgi:tRNA threonylcarbamoyladenosine modification (KEOPS) complex Cgi121 subunit
MEIRCYKIGSEEEPQALRDSIQKISQSLLVQTVKEGVARNESLVSMLVEQTNAATSSHTLLARRREVDLLLRLGGTTQISVALRTVGATKGEPFDVILAGDRGDIESAERLCLPRGERAGKGGLGRRDLERIEKAALLNAVRG